MNNIQLSPYLHFEGNCEEALNFYKNIFGGDLELSRFGDMPLPGHKNDKDKIMHGVLKNDQFSFMASDGGSQKLTMGNNFSMSLSGPDEATLRNYFDGLADGGKITMPLAKQPWGDEFGMITDKFAIDWMVNITAEKK